MPIKPMSLEEAMRGEPIHLWFERMAGEWRAFQQVARRVVDPATFHQANDTLGYNLARAVSPLLDYICLRGSDEACHRRIAQLEVQVEEYQAKCRAMEKAQKEVRQTRGQ